MKYKKIILFIIIFFILWAGAWLLHDLLEATIWPILGSLNNYNLLYWVIMKILVWVIFPIFYVKKILQVKDNNKLYGLQYLKRGIIYGLVAGLIWFIGSYIIEYFKAGEAVFKITASFTFIWLITGTPFTEEFTFRGVIQPRLQKYGMKFWFANIITSIIFILIHCLGWSFQGTLTTNLFSINAGSILLISLIVGWLRYKSKSVYSSILFHSINNLFSSII